MHSKKDSTLALLGGAALGAAAMYLLDPDAGARRRRELAEKTGDATTAAGETLEPLWERVSDTARHFGNNLASGASAFGHAAADKIDAMRAGTSEAASQLGEQASDIASGIADSVKRASHRAREAAKAPAHWFEPEPEPSHAGAYAATGVGAILLGAAAMYLFDPQHGRSRRNMIADEATKIVRRTGRSAQQIGSRLRDRATGRTRNADNSLETEDALSAEQLLLAIRSEIGPVVSHAGSIQVMTDNHGRVTLHGKVLASEADKLLATVRSVGGVTEIVNLLSVKETEQQMADDTGNTGESVARL